MGRIIGYQETNGPVATFETDVARKIKKLEANIVPIQDLHGYNSPWPAGGGKNLFNSNAPNLVDGYIGTTTFATSNKKAKTVYISISPSTTYTISKSAGLRFSVATAQTLPSDGAELTNIQAKNTASALTITSGANDTYLWAFIYLEDTDTIAFDAMLASVQIEIGSTATSWEPYSNICPITGWTGAKVSRTGINLWDEEWEVGAINVNTGENTAIQSQIRTIRTKNFIPVKPGMSVFIVSPNQGNGGSAGNLQGRYYDKGKQYLGSNPAMRVGQAITIPNDCYYVRFGTQTIYGSSYNHDISINYPSTDMQYHAYQGYTYDITFPSAAGTVYGGTLDVVKGELVVDRAMVDMGTLTWAQYPTNANVYYSTSLTQKEYGNTNIISDSFVVEVVAVQILPIGKMRGVSNQSTVYFSLNVSTVQDFLNAVTGKQLVYKLATPITYQLTPQEINTIIGTNTIYTDTGDTSVIYPKTITPIETVSNANLMELRRGIIASQPHLDTKSGSTVSLKSSVSKVKDLAVNINPVQSGSGDPSPDNVRPITGWTGAKVTKCGKNLLDIEPYRNLLPRVTNGITWSKVRDGVYHVQGTATAVSYFNISFRQDVGNAMPCTSFIGQRLMLSTTDARVLPEIGYFREDGTYTNITNGGIIPDNAVGLRAYVRVVKDTVIDADFSIQFELGSTATEYEPYQGSTYDITFPAEAGTVYGGTLDVVNGTLTLTHKGGFFNDLYSSGINAMTTNASDVRRWGLPKSMFDGIANAESNNQPEDFLCSAYKTITAANSWSRNNGISVTITGLVVIFDENYSDKATTTNSGAVAYFSDINPFFVWKLETPITYQLTSQEIALLRGNNTIYADCGDTTISYFTN